jgi:hypothetical protein
MIVCKRKSIRIPASLCWIVSLAAVIRYSVGIVQKDIPNLGAFADKY